MEAVVGSGGGSGAAFEGEERRGTERTGGERFTVKRKGIRKESCGACKHPVWTHRAAATREEWDLGSQQASSKLRLLEIGVERQRSTIRLEYLKLRAWSQA